MSLFLTGKCNWSGKHEVLVFNKWNYRFLKREKHLYSPFKTMNLSEWIHYPTNRNITNKFSVSSLLQSLQWKKRPHHEHATELCAHVPSRIDKHFSFESLSYCVLFRRKTSGRSWFFLVIWIFVLQIANSRCIAKRIRKKKKRYFIQKWYNVRFFCVFINKSKHFKKLLWFRFWPNESTIIPTTNKWVSKQAWNRITTITTAEQQR